jgi:hypothetical protein
MNGGPLYLIVAVLCVFLLWGIARVGMGARADFVIRYRPGGKTTVSGRVPAGRAGESAEFFRRDLRPSGPVTVRGTFDEGRRLRVTFSGTLNAFERQRVRNFLVERVR